MATKVSEEPCLSPTDLRVVYKELFEVRAKWRRLGLELDLTPGTLDAIQQRYNEPEDQLERVLLDWLKRGSSTWKQLVEALWSTPVSETKLARDLEGRYCPRGEVTNAKFNLKRTHNSRDDVEQLCSEIKTLKRRFAGLLTATRESIKERLVSPLSLVALLSAYRANVAVMKKEDKLLADRQEDLERADDVDKIFVIMSPFLSFLDFEILEDIINSKNLGADSDRQNLADYIRSLKELLDSWKVEPFKVLRDESELLRSRATLCFKLDADSLSMYRDVKVAIARVLGVQVYALQLCSIEDGCIELVFLVPKVAIGSLLPLESLSNKLSVVEPQVLKVTLVDGNTTESVVLKEPSSSSPVTQGVLTISDLKEVYAATFKAQDDWKNILLELGVSSATVERIGVSYSDTPDHCYHEGLSEWLEGGERSWGDLVKALLSPTVGHSDMATVIEKDFLRLPTKQSGAVLQKKEEDTQDDHDYPHDLRPQFTVTWGREKDMPVKMGATVQSVVIDESVYVGGGIADNHRNECTVMKLVLQRDEWTQLPQYNTMFFAMTSLDNQLVLVGGQSIVTRELTNRIAVFESGQWTTPYPPMNIARSYTSTVVYFNCLIVAGGSGEQGPLSSVEILDVLLRKWYLVESLPNPQSRMKSTLIGNTLYLMGRFEHTDPTKMVHKVDLKLLIQKTQFRQASSTLWQTTEDTPLKRSAPLNVGGSLLAVGGRDDHDNPSSSIHLYQPDTRRWVKVGDLPTARYDCTCSVLPSGEVIVAGGQTGPLNYLSTVDFLFITITH